MRDREHRPAALAAASSCASAGSRALERARAMWLLLAAAVIASVPLLARADQPQRAALTPADRAAVSEWSRSTWRLADGGREDAVVEAIARAPAAQVLDAAGAEWLSESFDSFRSNLERRETERATKLTERSAEFDGLLAELLELPAGSGERAIAASKAIAVAVQIDLLTLDKDKDALFADERFATLESAAVAEAEAAEQRGSWLLANELYGRLETLFERRRPYEEQFERLTRRLIMIQLYTPQRYWTLRNERRLAEGLDPLAPYNPFGDGHDAKLAGITESMVLSAVVRASDPSTGHVEHANVQTLLLAGIEAVELLASTPDLDSAFPGLGDPAAVERFLAAVRELRDARPRWPSYSIRATGHVLERLLDANDRSVKLPREAVLFEFGVGAMSELDDYSQIIWPHDIAQFERSIKGAFVGIGVQIQYDERLNIKIVTPLEGTPAQLVGLRADDVITSVDGHDARGFTLNQAVDTITGKDGTDVQLSVERVEEGVTVEKNFVITRRAIRLPTVKGWKRTGAGDDDWEWMVDPRAGIGYIRLTGFSDTTTNEFDTAIARMRASGSGLNGLILDLRYNPGGLMDQAVMIASRFVERGLIVKTEDAQGREQSSHRARPVPDAARLSELPVIVLINEGSASASEIVSGAIQAHAEAEGARTGFRALLIGARTFGKGSVQQVFPISSKPAEAYMKLTTQYYKLRGGQKIHRTDDAEVWGISPDLAIQLLPEQENRAVLLRRDADLVLLDDQGGVIEPKEKHDPEELLTEGLDLQLQAGLVMLQAEYAGQRLALAAGEPEDQDHP